MIVESNIKRRIESIDLLRGLVMIIMALDHTRDLLHFASFTSDPLDPASTTPALYFTRWITHFCAPTFVFLSGMSAWLQGKRKTKKELSRFLITRGLWLILVDLTIMSLGLTADIRFGAFVLETLWSIGISMALLGLFIWLPFNLILLTGLLIFFGHNLLDFAEKNRNGAVPVWWSLLHRVAFVPLWKGHSLFIFYPFLSWTGLLFLGYCCGRLFTDIDAARRKKILLWTGIGMLAFFVALRFTNAYGDPGHWTRQRNGLTTFFSFMNVSKYPPSLLFLCATIGPGLIFLALVKNTGTRIAKIITVYGKVPFFYFIVHFYILHLTSVLLFLSRGHGLTEGMNNPPGGLIKFTAPGEGWRLWQVYLAWFAILVIMYPLCKWYGQYKANHPENKFLSYI